MTLTVEPVFDFAAGEFKFSRGGEIYLATGKEALQTQIEKVLRTVAGRFRIYDGSGYGTRIESLIVGKSLPADYAMSEIERCIKEAVLELDGVLSVSDFNVSRSGSKLTVSFDVRSIYGDLNERGMELYG